MEAPNQQLAASLDRIDCLVPALRTKRTALCRAVGSLAVADRIASHWIDGAITLGEAREAFGDADLRVPPKWVSRGQIGP